MHDLDQSTDLREAASRDADYKERSLVLFLIGAPLLLGVSARHIGPQREEFHNSVVLVFEDGRLQDPYHKMHLVLFGEYVPLADRWPWLYELTPLHGGLTPGEQPASLVEVVEDPPDAAPEPPVAATPAPEPEPEEPAPKGPAEEEVSAALDRLLGKRTETEAKEAPEPEEATEEEEDSGETMSQLLAARRARRKEDGH